MDFPSPQDHCCQIMQQIFKLLKDQKLCDLVVFVEDKEFWVHRCVLAASCPTLHDIIIKETSVSPQNTIHLTLQGLSSDGFQVLIDYLYSGKPPFNVSEKELKGFKKACYALGISDVRPSVTENKSPQKEPPETKEPTSGPESDNDYSFYDDSEEVTQFVIEVMTSPDPKQKRNQSKKNTSKKTVHLQTVKEELSQQNQFPVSDEPEETSDANDMEAIEIDQGGGEMEEDMEEVEETNEEVRESDDMVVEAREGNEENVIPSMHEIQLATEVKAAFKTERETDSIIEECKRLKRRGRPRLANDFLFPMQPPFVCPHANCNKECDSREKLKKHYRIHDMKTHICDKCAQAFHYNKDLIAHYRTHTGEKPYSCEICGASFAQKSTLTNHMESHQNKKTLTCDACGRLYSTLRSLNLHRKEKHSEKPAEMHKCQHCNKEYSSRSAFLHHLNTQCSSSVYLCSQCGKTYRREEAYRRHIEKCKGKVVFKCQYCSKVLKTQNSLSYHLDSKHGKEQDENVVEEEHEEPDVVAEAVSTIVTAEDQGVSANTEITGVSLDNMIFMEDQAMEEVT